jgi:hypothetical protein
MAAQHWMDGLSALRVFSPIPCVGWTPGGGNYDYIEGSFEVFFKDDSVLKGKWSIWHDGGSQPWMRLMDSEGNMITDKRLTKDLKREIQVRANRASCGSFVLKCLEMASRTKLYPEQPE